MAFVLPAGISAIEPRLQELLGRGGHLRFLTGDYLDGSDPDALMRLVDLHQLDHPGRLELRVFELGAAVAYAAPSGTFDLQPSPSGPKPHSVLTIARLGLQ